MKEFYNPYQFLPVTGKINGERSRHRVEYDAISHGESASNPTVRHDLWHKDGLSGRILCSLYLNTPTIVGSHQGKSEQSSEAESTRVIQYTWNGTAAIPGNSLKGMIAATAEALSQSALRVLDQHAGKTVRVDLEDRGTTKREPMRQTTHDFFRHIDEDVTPWMTYSSGRKRNDLTPAECLFGVVEIVERAEAQTRNQDEAPSGEHESSVNSPNRFTESGRNLAGRVRFFDARSATGQVDTIKETTLRILSSPYLAEAEHKGKLCPAMYFHLRGQPGGYLSKRDIFLKGRSKDILPNGRKVYLHHPARQIDGNEWETSAPEKNPEQKLRCEPMKAGQTFFFHIDFENLTAAELTLLEHAIAPAAQFQHRIGLGKPLGLGSVTICIEGVFIVDRAKRYGPNALDEPQLHYHHIWRPDHSPDEQRREADFSASYPREWAALHESGGLQPKPIDFHDCALIHSETLESLIKVGDPNNLKNGNPPIPVRTPFTEAQVNTPEEETFKWFNENESQGGQALRPILEGGEKLPTLLVHAAEAAVTAYVFSPDLSSFPKDDSDRDVANGNEDSQNHDSEKCAAEPELANDPQVAEWLISVCERITGQCEANKSLDVLAELGDEVRQAGLATEIVGIDDVDLQHRVFALVCGVCGEHQQYFFTKAEKLYRNAGLVPKYE